MENNLGNFIHDSLVDKFVKTDNVLNDMCGIIESSREAAYKAVNVALVQRNAYQKKSLRAKHVLNMAQVS